ncbi:MAG: MotA/TolQ/ExbB proton channel family protein [Desulfomonilia bacterium]|nr:MotA/TolQ/ExbB proton channel family protein [Desulfomonilia bacterium]
MELLAKSGIVGYILAGISVVTLAIFLERVILLHLERRRLSRGVGIMEKISDMIAVNSSMSSAQLGELISFKIEDKIEQLSSSITFLRLASTISPLLGLLGTVLGMIQAFREVSEMGGAVKPAALASGIWVALLTTAEGLIVAITAFFMYHYLQHLVGRIGKSIARKAEVLLIEQDHDTRKS